MRNLKKMLSLVMALAMVASFMVVGASAAGYNDFNDKDKIANTEAVSMLVELGIIKGRDTGSFDPEGIVTRAEMAKMICIVLNGGRDPQLSNGSNFTDVKGTANAWADSYIAFCANLGIIAGYGDGTFKPGNTVTGTEAAKMLLVALGYQAEIAGFTGVANWAVNVDVAANKINLYKGMTLNTSAGLTRDNAALMIFNGLNAKTVTYEYTLAPVNGVLTSIPTLKEGTKTLLEDAFKAVKVEGVVVANEYARLSSNSTDDNKNVIGSALDVGKTTVLVSNYDDQDTFKDVENTFSVTTGADVLGREVTLYVKPASTASKSTVLGNAIVNENNKVVTDYSGDSIATVADDNDLDITSATMVATNFAGLDKLSSTAAKDKTLVNPGMEKVLIDYDNDGKVDYVLLNSFAFGKVTSYSTKDDGSITINVGGKTMTASDKKNVVGFEDVKKDDYVMAAFIGGKLHVNVAETITGTLEAYKTDSTLTIDGTKYNVSKIAGYTSSDIYAANGYGKSDNLDTEATFYIDNYGYVVAAGDVTANAGNFAYVVAADSTGVLNRQVKVVLSDGTEATYKLSDKSDTVSAAGGAIFSYTMSSTNEIKLFNKTGVTTSGEGTNAQFTKGKTALKATGINNNNNYYTSSSTVFFYVSDNGKDVNVYTGYANAPSLAASGVKVKVLTDANNKVLAVYATGASITATDVSDHLFVYSWGNTYNKYTEANVVLAGTEETQTIKVNVSSSVSNLTADKPYLFTMDKDGYYVLAEVGANLITNSTPKKADYVSNTTIVVDGQEYKIIADSVLIDNSEDATPSVTLKSAPNSDDKIQYVLKNGDGEALMIVINNGKTSGGNTGDSTEFKTTVTEAAGEQLTVRHYGNISALQVSNAVREYLLGQDNTIQSVSYAGGKATATWANGTSIEYTVTVKQVFKVTVTVPTGFSVSSSTVYGAQGDTAKVTLTATSAMADTDVVTGTPAGITGALSNFNAGKTTADLTLTLTTLTADTTFAISSIATP